MIQRALISVSDKRGIVELGRFLADRGVELLSTGGTARALADAGIPVVKVSDYTGAPELLDGRVKTLHPRIHAGILARPTEADGAELARHGLGAIDLVVVNLYPFAATVARGAGFDETLEQIDVGGPTMVRAAAKTHARVGVVVDPADYPALQAELGAAGALSPATRLGLARKAFAHTAAYDAAIAAWLSGEALPELLPLALPRRMALRYGENPHQAAAFYVDPRPGAGPSLGRAEILQGKELSYNNLLDLDAALGLALDLDAAAAVVVKHTNPCGVAVAATAGQAYRRAREADPLSAFGGIVAFNQVIDEDAARALAETFLECVVAPAFAPEARAVLAAKRDLRLVAVGALTAPAAPPPALRSVRGGVLVQEVDRGHVDWTTAPVATRRAPTAEELADLAFAWRVCKHVKSNAIVIARGGVTLGIGCGQTSRVDAVRLAVAKAGEAARGAALASDAFFPFRDGVDEAARAGVSAFAQPGGSRRDAEVLAAADEHGATMVLTGVRHFRH